MGVKGLQTFIERSCPEVCCKIDLRQLTADYKRAHPKIDPVIVVDGYGCLTFFNQDVEWIYGGQYMQIKARVVKFINCFREIGVSLVFIFDGLTANCKTNAGNIRKLATMESVATMYHCLKSEIPLTDDTGGHFPAAVGDVIKSAIKDCGRSNVFENVIGECDTTVVTYAIEHQCMALLGQDTDYVIYDLASKNIPYLLVNHLQFKTMEIVSYSQNIFCQKTGLQLWLLPLFACLVSNDYISREQLSDFHHELRLKYEKHRSLFPFNYSKTIEFIVRYLNENRIDKVEQLNELIAHIWLTMPLTQISWDVLRRAMTVYSLDYSSVKFYPSPVNLQLRVANGNYSDMWDLVCRMTASYELTPFIYEVLGFGRVERKPSMEDESDTSFQPIVIIYRLLRCRMYSVVFMFREMHLQNNHLVYRGNTVEEVCFMMSKKSLLPYVVEPLPIEAEPFDVAAFWLDHGNELKTQKMEALFAVMGATMSSQRFLAIPDQFKTLCLIINYFVQHPGVPLAPWEVDAFIVQAVIPNCENLRWIADLQVKPVTRAMHMAVIFGRSCMLDVVSLCGKPYPIESVSIWNFFDGKRFHYCWSALKSGQNVEQLCLKNSQRMALFQQLKETTLEGIDIKKCFQSETFANNNQ